MLSVVLCVAPLAALAQEVGDGGPATGEPTPGLEAAEAIVLALGGAVEADLIVSQVQAGNTLSQTNVTETAEIHGSFSGNTGILQVNQDAGAFTNQANVVAIAIGGHGDGAFADTATAQGVAYVGNKITISGGDYKNSIHDSFNGVSGITQVNQNTGAFNNQANVVAVGIGFNAGEAFQAIDDMALAGYAGDNEILIDGPIQTENSITDSFNGHSGILQVNQISGGVGVTAAQAVNVNMIPVAP